MCVCVRERRGGGGRGCKIASLLCILLYFIC